MSVWRALALAGLLAATACVPKPAPPPSPPPAAVAANPVVGGAEMLPTRTLLANLTASRDHGRFVAAVRGAGLEGALGGGAAHTVFAPTDAAFAALPNGTLDALMNARSRPELQSLVGLHILPRQLRRTDIAIAGGSRYPTLNYGAVVARVEGGRILLTDANNRRVAVTQADIRSSNGIIHVIDVVLLPRI